MTEERTNSIKERLNSEKLLPEGSYRRNKVIYELVCYVNCAIGAEISNRHSVVDLFCQRIDNFMETNPASADYERYYELVREYVSAIRGRTAPRT